MALVWVWLGFDLRYSMELVLNSLRKKRSGLWSEGEKRWERAVVTERDRERDASLFLHMSGLVLSLLQRSSPCNRPSLLFSQLNSESAVQPDQYAVRMRDAAITLYPRSVYWCIGAPIRPCTEQRSTLITSLSYPWARHLTPQTAPLGLDWEASKCEDV